MDVTVKVQCSSSIRYLLPLIDASSALHSAIEPHVEARLKNSREHEI